MTRSWIVAALVAGGCAPAQQVAGDAGGADLAQQAGPDLAQAGGADLAQPGADGGAPGGLCNVTPGAQVACPVGMGGPPAGSRCRTLTVDGCPGIEAETIQATIAVLGDPGSSQGTVVHFSGSGGQGWEVAGAAAYAGFLQVFVSWGSTWEQTASAGIKTAAARPASVLRWIWGEPTLHASSRAKGFCGQGHSGGSGQLAYALATYGMGDYLDYVNELAGPPFARIDLGCDPAAPTTAMVCGVDDTMVLPGAVGTWDNTSLCRDPNATAEDVARWKADSVAIGGVYAYPKTDVEFYDCTYQSTAVSGEAQLYATLIAQTEGAGGMVGYHCYGQADGCMMETLGPKATADFTQALIAGCIPRH